MKCHLPLLLSAVVCLAASSSQATTINFDSLPSNVTITNQYPEATFMSITGYEYRTFAFPNGSVPNVIAGYSNSGSFAASSELFVNFAFPVNNLSFKVVGDNSTAPGTIDVFVNNALSSTFSLTADNNGSTADLNNLSSFSGVTSIHIYNVTDPGGIGYDDFTFTPVPEPSTWAMLALGAGIGAFALRRRRIHLGFYK